MSKNHKHKTSPSLPSAEELSKLNIGDLTCVWLLDRQGDGATCKHSSSEVLAKVQEIHPGRGTIHTVRWYASKLRQGEIKSYPGEHRITMVPRKGEDNKEALEKQIEKLQLRLGKLAKADDLGNVKGSDKE